MNKIIRNETTTNCDITDSLAAPIGNRWNPTSQMCMKRAYKPPYSELLYFCTRKRGHDGYCHDHSGNMSACWLVWEAEDKREINPVYKNRIQQLRTEMATMQ
jgi:hypothetical protein